MLDKIRLRFVMNNNHKKKVHIVENSGLGEKLSSGILKERTWI